jgi:hypothetical membrane protein
LVVILSILTAIELSPNFSWTNNALSDLGVQDQSSTAFNSGLIIGGVIIAVFALGLWMSLRSKILGNLGGFLLLLSSAALCGIGIFTENAGDIHLYVSVAFFALVVLSLWIIGATLVQMKEKMLGLLLIIAGLFAAAVWALYPVWPSLALPETISALAAFACLITLGVRLFKQT